MTERGTSQDKPMKPQVVAHELNKLLTDDAIIATDSGTITTWAARHLNIRGNMMFSCSGNLATMACGLPYAVAAAVAYPGRGKRLSDAQRRAARRRADHAGEGPARLSDRPGRARVRRIARSRHAALPHAAHRAGAPTACPRVRSRRRAGGSYRASERAALAAAAHVVVTSAATGRIIIADYGVRSDRISVVRPGNDRVAPARGSNDAVVRVLSIGSVVPGKGYDLLIAALSTIRDLPWRLTIAGDRTRDPAAAARLDADIAAHDLGERIAVLGAVPPDRVVELYAASDVFVLASRFEGYGMALAEAISHGLPVVSTTAGAIPETIPSGAGLLVPPNDAPALAAALRRLIGDRRERDRHAMNARAAAARLPTWQDSARLFAGAIQRVG